VVGPAGLEPATKPL